jgi:hypothetical protein
MVVFSVLVCTRLLHFVRQQTLTLLFSRSASFYPQPISNYFRKSTIGLAIDFPTLNVLGFWCYTISSASFLYSPTIRAQYAYRHPEAPLTTVRFNDFLFAAHGAVMCVIIYSQFFPQVWNFKVGKTQTASRPVLGIFWGLVFGVLVVVLLALWQGKDGGNDASGWAWIDVVSAYHVVGDMHAEDSRISLSCQKTLPTCFGLCMHWICADSPNRSMLLDM